MKKIICLVFAAVLLAVLCITVFADTPLLSSDKSDNANGKPYWYPLDTTGFTDFHGENLPYVVDDADILTDAQESALSEKIEAISEKYGIGYVVFTDDDLHGLSPEYYASDFLHFNGYGRGNGYGAIVFFICLDPSDRGAFTIAINSCERKITSDTVSDINDSILDDLKSESYYSACLTHVKMIEKIYHPPIFKIVLTGLIVGIVVALIRVFSLKKQMKINPPTTANNYLLRDTYVVRDRRCDFLYTTLTRHEKPKQTSSSSGGGSSYSSGRSSGGSFSGGGVRF